MSALRIAELRVLLGRVRDQLEATWDCTCSGDAECERCATFAEIDAARKP